MDAQATSLSDGRERLGTRAGVIVGGLIPFLDSLVEPVVCADRDWRVLYRNPVFAASWKVEPGSKPQVEMYENGTVVAELADHGGSSVAVTLETTAIADASGRTVAYIARVGQSGEDVIGELRHAAAVIAARIANLDHGSVGTSWCDDDEARVQSLSKREREIFDLILDGNRVATVAADLYLSEHTVRNYLKRIYHKLDVHSLGELRERMGRGAARSAS